MKSERLLSMLLLLQAQRRLAAREIATRLEVSERTVYRDRDSLSAAGIPVYAERGVHGGIVLSDGYRKALTQFREDEIRALFVSSANPLADLGLDVGLRRALDKLAGALPDTQRRAAAKSQSRIYLDPQRWHQAAQPREFLDRLRRCVWDDRRALLTYRDSKAAVTERTIEPLGLVAKAGIWYLVAVSRGQMRVFRAERIIEVSETTERFERPADFDLDSFWRRWSAEFVERLPSYEVVLRVAPDAVEDITHYWQSTVLEKETPDRTHDSMERSNSFDRDWKTVRLTFPAMDVAMREVIAWGGRIQIVEPKELSRRAAAIASAFLAAHARP